MRIKEAISSIIQAIEGDNFYTDYFLRKDLEESLEYEFKGYYDIGSVHLQQIIDFLKEKTIIEPKNLHFSFSSIALFCKKIFLKKYKSRKVLSKSAIVDYNKFYLCVREAISKSDLNKDLKKQPQNI